jgi:hypothetical protein
MAWLVVGGALATLNFASWRPRPDANLEAATGNSAQVSCRKLRGARPRANQLQFRRWTFEVGDDRPIK